MSNYQVVLAPEAQDDLERLCLFALERDAGLAERALVAIENAYTLLRHSPFSCRKAADGKLGHLVRELVIPFGAAGYVALFEILNDTTVLITAVRHQRESDYH
ncbi:MAG: type II toxin-antitoxin system RelE/ParE family toxin [Rhodoferax sp.]|nr:type II toxin-antitoxin system RelE/ParE family toxin [Rhodoferax sp.]